jgi:hypothetical protein
MSLTIAQKSSFLLILNATMVFRSVGKYYLAQNKNITEEEKDEKLKNFKRLVFDSADEIIGVLEKNISIFDENFISKKIENVAINSGATIGQAQKAINVLLKNYFILSNKQNKTILEKLHCPIDSVVLNGLGYEKKTNLTKLNTINEYNQIQKLIQNETHNTKIEFDNIWDLQHLKRNNIKY